MIKKGRKDMSLERYHLEIYRLILWKSLEFSSWQNLRILHLSNNKIILLPKELGTLPHLQELDLSKNYLGLSDRWTWLDEITIKRRLSVLNISNNYLAELPVQIGKLTALKKLNVYQNMLESLPQNIGFLKTLEFLNLSNNMLLYLPGSLFHSYLQYIDISNNPFSNDINRDVNYVGFPSLAELSGRCIIRHKIVYNTKIIPSIFVKYLDNAKCCFICRNACFETYVSRIKSWRYIHMLAKQDYSRSHDLNDICKDKKLEVITIISIFAVYCYFLQSKKKKISLLIVLILIVFHVFFGQSLITL